MSATRWLKFNAVGFGGILLQLSVLALLASILRINYVLATAVAVEAAIIHNYLWHERYTWADRNQTNFAGDSSNSISPPELSRSPATSG